MNHILFKPILSQHNAPSVTYPLGRSRLQAVVWFFIWAVGLLAVGGWTYTSQQFDWRHVSGLFAVLCSGVAGYQNSQRLAIGQLSWDGQVWRWASQSYLAGAVEFELSVAVDFQHIMLLRIGNPASAKLWLWAEKGKLPERWMDLRRAVYSPHREAMALTRLA